MRYFVEPEKTLMEKVVYYSILLRNIRITLLQLRNTMLCIRGLNFTIPNFEDLREVEAQLINRANEAQNACRILMRPIFEGIDFGHDKMNHWGLSMNDIRCGYCELEEILKYDVDGKPKVFGNRFILLIEDYEDPTLGKFYGGELIKENVAVHFVYDIPKKETKLKGLYDAVISNFELAARYRQSKLKI